MEVLKDGRVHRILHGLNPYYNGRYSWRLWVKNQTTQRPQVLILIIMEDTHGELRHISP